MCGRKGCQQWQNNIGSTYNSKMIYGEEDDEAEEDGANEGLDIVEDHSA